MVPFIDAILEADRAAPRKQRHTAHRVYQRIRTELPGCEVAESTVRRLRVGKEASSGTDPPSVPSVALPCSGRGFPAISPPEIPAAQTNPYGLSHLPDSVDRKTASITAIFLIASSTETGTSPPSRIALENESP